MSIRWDHPNVRAVLDMGIPRADVERWGHDNPGDEDRIILAFQPSPGHDIPTDSNPYDTQSVVPSEIAANVAAGGWSARDIAEQVARSTAAGWSISDPVLDRLARLGPPPASAAPSSLDRPSMPTATAAPPPAFSTPRPGPPLAPSMRSRLVDDTVPGDFGGPSIDTTPAPPAAPAPGDALTAPGDVRTTVYVPGGNNENPWWPPIFGAPQPPDAPPLRASGFFGDTPIGVIGLMALAVLFAVRR